MPTGKLVSNNIIKPLFILMQINSAKTSPERCLNPITGGREPGVNYL